MPPDVLARRLPLYAYLEPLFAGRKVLEIGRAREGSAEYLLAHGAARVINTDGDVGNVTDRFDVVVVPEADALLGVPGVVSSWKALLANGGRLVAMVSNPDRSGGGSGGAGYYELSDALGTAFPTVQMLAVTPFLGVGLVEFGGAADGLRIDSRFVKTEAEAPVSYVAVAGTESVTGLGYALVQLPWISGPLREVESSVELRRKLQEAAAQAESAMRVARAQSDEIEELRGRLRRGSEDRAALDAEIAKLRQALAEADDSVVSLTRRTAEQMSVVAEKLASGLRIPALGGGDAPDLAAARAEADRLRARLQEAEARATAAEQRLEEIGSTARERATALEDALERLRLSEAELGRARRAAARAEEEARAASADARSLGERDQAVLVRDERIARLETEKQDLIWRLSELEDRLREAIARAVREAPRGAAGEARAEGEITAVRVAREKALAGFHAAATAHVGELTELKASVSEQAALVAELEDAVSAAEARAAAAEAELSGLRKTAKDLGEADRTRRSRLAELEGKLLRLEHERKAAGAQGPAGNGDDLDRVRRALEAERDQARRQVTEVEAERAGWTREREALAARIDELERAAASKNGHDTGTAAIARELEAIETELRSEVARIEAVAAAAGAPSGAGPAVAPDDETTSRLRDTLGNYRQRAERLRDDLVGVRRRLDELSPTEIASFLEELGDDLAELGK